MISWPNSAYLSTIWLPMNPAAPVTNILILDPSFLIFSLYMQFRRCLYSLLIIFINAVYFSSKGMGVKIHSSAEVSEKAKIGENTAIWNHTQIRENSEIGDGCNISKNVYIDFGVKIGNNVKIQNNVSVYNGVTIEDDVFLGPSMVFTNDLYPRSFIWESGQIGTTLVKRGASIGANATIICGDRVIGKYAMVAAGSVVTKNIPDYGLVVGNPARLVGFVCKCGRKSEKVNENIEKNVVVMKCNHCNKEFEIRSGDYGLLVK